MNTRDLSHFDEHGASRMVDIGSKPVSQREARASGRLRMRAETLQRIRVGQIQKGDVLGVARLAAIMAAKRTAELIPLCHLLPLTSVEVQFSFPSETQLGVETTVRTQAQTGVEMEALTATAIASLTVYDMCKSIDRDVVIEQLQLEEKTGGKSGHFRRSPPPA